jgi:hypothetical protein
MLSRRALIAIGAITVAGAGGTYLWFRGTNKAPVFTGIIPGVALGGYDTVAYFTVGTPTPGREDLSLLHDGATWRFASEDNRRLFRADPNRYAPQYGGYCAYAVADGGTSGGNPKAWRIVNGRLYVNATPRVQLKWETDIPGYIKKADANWPQVLRP